MAPETSHDAIGSRDSVWSAVLRCLAEQPEPIKYGDVEPYLAEELEDPPSPRTVNRVMTAMVALEWLSKNSPSGRKYYPGEHARRYLDLEGATSDAEGQERAADEVQNMIGDVLERASASEIADALEDIDDVDDEDDGGREAAESGRERDVVRDEELEALEDLPGQGETLAARRDAVRACLELLVERGEASKSDFIDEVYPDHPAGYSSSGAWWNAVGKKGLRELVERREDVDAPKPGGSTWRAGRT